MICFVPVDGSDTVIGKAQGAFRPVCTTVTSVTPPKPLTVSNTKLPELTFTTFPLSPGFAIEPGVSVKSVNFSTPPRVDMVRSAVKFD